MYAPTQRSMVDAGGLQHTLYAQPVGVRQRRMWARGCIVEMLLYSQNVWRRLASGMLLTCAEAYL